MGRSGKELTRLRAKKMLAPVTGLFSLCVVLTAGVTFAQGGSEETNAGDMVEEVVVVGTRRQGVSAIESMSPIDLVQGEALQNQGASNLNDALRTLVPALNVQQFVGQDGSAFIRPFTLRGLAPDQTLLLVNGKRRHRAALVQITNQPLAAGSHGADLGVIPAIAIDRVEVLRDGAAAQYGSDAIAGVMNFVLKSDNSGGSVAVRYGEFFEGDGQDLTIQGNIGLPLTANGFINISAEHVTSDPTSRGVQRANAQELIDAGNTAVPVPAQRWGNIDSEATRFFVNAEVPATESVTAYAFGNYSESEGESAFFYRSPVARQDIFASVPLSSSPGGPRFSFSEQFPGGFTPQFGAEIQDISMVLGARGELASGLTFDVSGRSAQNKMSYRISNTVNPSLGPDSPTSFKPGEIRQREAGVNADFTFPFQLASLASPLNVAFGAEYRRETYELQAGDVASWTAGPFSRVFDPDTNQTVGLAVGSSGFPGISPDAAGSFSRDSWAAYVDLEADVTSRLTLGAALRAEDYSDFGSTSDWKLSGRFEVSDGLAFRASVNTGFRAPTPGQANVKEIATNIDLVTGDLQLTATLPPADPISQYFGSQPLETEESLNYSAGIVAQFLDGYTLTVDLFNIEVENRIALTSRIPITADDRTALEAIGLDPGSFRTVRFLGNFFDTETKGVDIVLSKTWAINGGTLGMDLSANFTETEVTKIRDPRAVNREREVEVSDFNPDWRGFLAFNYAGGKWSGSVRANYYGEWTDAVATQAPPNAFDQTFGEAVLVDVQVNYEVSPWLSLTVGADNIFDEYPDKDERVGQQGNGIVYPQFSPFGFSGGLWYLKATASF